MDQKTWKISITRQMKKTGNSDIVAVENKYYAYQQLESSQKQDNQLHCFFHFLLEGIITVIYKQFCVYQVN